MWLIVIGKCSVIKQVVVRQKTEFVQTPDPLLFLSLFIRSLSFLCLHSYNYYVISVLFIIICHLHIKKIFCFISTDTCSEWSHFVDQQLKHTKNTNNHHTEPPSHQLALVPESAPFKTIWTLVLSSEPAPHFHHFWTNRCNHRGTTHTRMTLLR